MGWFDQMARSAPSIPTPPGSQALSAVTGGPQAASGMAGMFSGGAPAGPNSVLGLMGGQLLNQQPQTGSLSALGGGINQGYDWTSGTPDPNQPIYHAGSDLEMRQPGWNQGPPQNSPQPVPGQPPRPFDPSQGGGQSTWDWRGVQDPRFGPGGVWDTGGNRGSGQPINQPVGGYQAPGMATWTPAPGVPNGWQQGGIENPYGSAGQQPTGSLQSLGGGQLNQSGMVTLRAPDGSQTKAVPADQVAHWLSRGAVRV